MGSNFGGELDQLSVDLGQLGTDIEQLNRMVDEQIEQYMAKIERARSLTEKAGAKLEEVKPYSEAGAGDLVVALVACVSAAGTVLSPQVLEIETMVKQLQEVSPDDRLAARIMESIRFIRGFADRVRAAEREIRAELNRRMPGVSGG